MASHPSSRATSRSVSSASVSRRNTNTTPELSPVEKEKAALITAACQSRDLGQLVRLATSIHGLVSDSLRRTAWPLLLGCTSKEDDGGSWKDLPPYGDEHQVALDVNRSFVYYPKNESDAQLDRRKEELSNVILAVLRRHPSLCYFQGYHDIVQVFLLVLGPHDAPAAVARLSLLRIRDFMISSLDPAIAHLELLHPILRTADPALYDHLPKSQPSFALAGTITMFAHNIQEYKDIARLFDFFLAHNAVMPIYFFSAAVLSRREEMFDIDKEDEDIMHAVLGKLPQPFDVEFHIARTVELYERLPPEKLGSWAWWRISSSSVLKTASTPSELTKMSLEKGEQLFLQQEVEVKRQQAFKKAAMRIEFARRKVWYYRKQSAYGLAIAVGVYALWLGKSRDNGSRSVLLGPLGAMLKKIMGLAV